MKGINGLIIFIAMLLSISSVLALVPYTGQPQLPYIIYGNVEWNDQLLSGSRLQILNINTGYTKLIITNGDGYWQEEAGNWKTVAPGRPPIAYGDIIRINVLDGCGTGDVCVKQFTAYTEGYNDFANIDFTITGELVCPQLSCPSCHCSSCSGGSTTVVNEDCSETKCTELFPCLPTSCDEPIVCADCEVCEDKVCDDCEVCVVPGEVGDNNNLNKVIGALLVVLLSGTATYLSFGTGANKIKIIKKDGKDLVYHKHPTVSGYHSLDTKHRNHPHVKGELVPKYVKVNSKWVYGGK